MKINIELLGIKLLYIETAPFIYFVEENARYIDILNNIFERLAKGQIRGFTSVITLTEVLMLPMRMQKHALVQAYRDILMNNLSVNVIQVSAEIAEAAARLRAIYNLRTPDALHIATAIDAGCDALLTNDIILKRVSEIKVIIIDELEA